MINTPDYVDFDEQPEFTKENIPEDVLEEAISIAVAYGECPFCEFEQFYPIVPGHNSSWDCRDCGEEMSIVG